MKRKHLQLLWLLALTLPFFTACKKDKEDVAPSNTELLVAHEWKGDQVLMMGINVSESGAVQNDVPDIKTLRLTFNRDNTYVAKSDNALTFEGDWRFNADETKIYFDFLGLGDFNVKKLTSDDLHLSTSISKSQLLLVASILNVEVGIINRFPDGTEFETEIRFIKP